MSDFSDGTNEVKPPLLANRIMYLLLPKRLFDNMVGDLEEEFDQLAKHDIKQANKWYWQQSIDTSMVYLQKKIGSVEVLGRLNFYLPVALFLIVTGLITLLSVLEEPTFISATFWDELLQGKIHTALFSDNFWHNFWSLLRMAEWGMFIHLESIVIATLNIVILIYLDKKQQASALKLALWGYSLAFIPYIWSIVHIAGHQFEAKQIGPIIATGLLSLMYMLIPVCYIVHRKLKRQQAELEKFEHNKFKQDHNQSH